MGRYGILQNEKCTETTFYVARCQEHFFLGVGVHGGFDEKNGEKMSPQSLEERGLGIVWGENVPMRN